MEVERLLAFAVESGASDVHLQSGAPPMVRISGQLRAIDSDDHTDHDVRGLVAAMLPESMHGDLESLSVAGLDFSHAVDDLARFRCNVFRHMGRWGAVIRIVRLTIPTLEELRLPDVVREIALSRRGLTLVTGTTGSGKSSTLAAMIDLVNATHRDKIITIEDPVEFVHANRRSLVTQVEVGTDTPSFERALRQSLRQDPDVILIGELRDAESLRIALHAADTGHQVLSTVHSANAVQTIERIVAMFPPEEHDLLLSQLSNSLEAVVSQRLVVTKDGGRRPAVEILRGSGFVDQFIADNQLDEIEGYMRNGESGMQTFDQHLLRLHESGEVAGTEALRWASNPESLSLAMRMSSWRRRDE